MVEKDDVRRAYDEVAETYAAERSDEGPGMAILSAFLDSLSRSARLLDVGCGNGQPVLAGLPKDIEAVGLDFSGAQLRLARATVPDCVLVHGEMTDLPFEDGSFDALVAYWSLIHLPLDHHSDAIAEFARVLRPGGRALVCEGTDEWVGSNPDWLDSGTEMAWGMAGAEATAEQLRDAGFEIIDRWRVPESLDGEEKWDSEGDHPWTFFSVRLEAHQSESSTAGHALPKLAPF